MQAGRPWCACEAPCRMHAHTTQPQAQAQQDSASTGVIGGGASQLDGTLAADDGSTWADDVTVASDGQTQVCCVRACQARGRGAGARWWWHASLLSRQAPTAGGSTMHEVGRWTQAHPSLSKHNATSMRYLQVAVGDGQTEALESAPAEQDVGGTDAAVDGWQDLQDGGDATADAQDDGDATSDMPDGGDATGNEQAADPEATASTGDVQLVDEGASSDFVPADQGAVDESAQVSTEQSAEDSGADMASDDAASIDESAAVSDVADPEPADNATAEEAVTAEEASPSTDDDSDASTASADPNNTATVPAPAEQSVTQLQTSGVTMTASDPALDQVRACFGGAACTDCTHVWPISSWVYTQLDMWGSAASGYCGRAPHTHVASPLSNLPAPDHCHCSQSGRQRCARVCPQRRSNTGRCSKRDRSCRRRRSRASGCQQLWLRCQRQPCAAARHLDQSAPAGRGVRRRLLR